MIKRPQMNDFLLSLITVFLLNVTIPDLITLANAMDDTLVKTPKSLIPQVDPVVTIFTDLTTSSISDHNDQAMKAIIHSYQLLTNQVDIGSHITGTRLVFGLRNTESIRLNFQEIDASALLRDFTPSDILVALATRSILNFLQSKGHVGKENVTLQTRLGYHGGDIRISPLIFLNLESGASSQFLVQFDRGGLALGDGIVTHAYAYLSEGFLCIFINSMNTTPALLTEIDQKITSRLNNK